MKLDDIREIVKALREAPNYNAGLGTSTLEDEVADLIDKDALREELWRLEGLALTQNGDVEETYTNGYRSGHRNGQIEILRRILHIREGVCESELRKPERSEE